MEKISIVKLRKHLTRPIEVTGERRQEGSGGGDSREAHRSSSLRERTGGWSGVDGGTVSGKAHNRNAQSVTLALTEGQTRALWSNHHVKEVAEGVQRLEGTGPGNRPVVLKLQFEAIPPLRMLRPREVAHMLGISKSLLNRLVGRGELPSYKIGRARRYMLDDIFSYLEKSCNVPGETS